jgi:hypothetical protein
MPVAHACKSWLLGRLRLGGLRFKASPSKQFPRLHLQNNQSKMDWQCNSSFLLVRIPEFKLKEKRNRERSAHKLF